MNEPGDDKNNLGKVAETLARESDISKDRRVKFTRKTKKSHWKPKEKKPHQSILKTACNLH